MDGLVYSLPGRSQSFQEGDRLWRCGSFVPHIYSYTLVYGCIPRMGDDIYLHFEALAIRIT
ncbi:hypothetical protein [Tolypothrix sp. VBCCA 56010]|uniref:hypothetical protein n=1 Tax=Tolypothrix sp. VBCCA 56010 TaxID=3137731 RepID=UPI003D7E6AF4